jgi:glucose-1-phosphate cytidylyltransferase
MKVVLFCGGLGTRLREHSETIPKPMVNIGYRPIIWHLMKYYSHFGHNEFILCLGYRGDVIKQYFLDYDECLSNNFTLSKGGKDLHLFSSDIHDWKITFVDTGLHSNLGQRLSAVEHYLGDDDEMFMANYTDGLTDLHLPTYLGEFRHRDVIASFISVHPSSSFHLVDMDGTGLVRNVQNAREAGMWINGGFFIFKRAIFKSMHAGEELVEEPFRRLIPQKQLLAYRYTGFWACMDTFKDKQRFDDMEARGETPWQVWRSPSTNA